MTGEASKSSLVCSVSSTALRNVKNNNHIRIPIISDERSNTAEHTGWKTQY